MSGHTTIQAAELLQIELFSLEADKGTAQQTQQIYHISLSMQPLSLQPPQCPSTP
jgi:hypothetical protein